VLTTLEMGAHVFEHAAGIWDGFTGTVWRLKSSNAAWSLDAATQLDRTEAKMLRANIFETIATISERERERERKIGERAKDEASSGCEGGEPSAFLLPSCRAVSLHLTTMPRSSSSNASRCP